MNGTHLTYDFNLFRIIKVTHIHYKKLKYHLKEKRRDLQIPLLEVTIMNGLVPISQALSLSCLFLPRSLSLSHTQADSFISMLLSHIRGLTDRILDADCWSTRIPHERT